MRGSRSWWKELLLFVEEAIIACGGVDAELIASAPPVQHPGPLQSTADDTSVLASSSCTVQQPKDLYERRLRK